MISITPAHVAQARVLVASTQYLEEKKKDPHWVAVHFSDQDALENSFIYQTALDIAYLEQIKD